MHEQEFDFIIVGSGGGSVPAALVIKDRGMRPLIIEKQALIGGTCAFSGGVIWIPNNDYLNAEGGNDSHERSRLYLDTVIGPPLPSSSLARRDAYIRGGAQMIRFLKSKGMKFIHAHWPDYYADRPGGIAEGRSLAAPLFDVNELGEWADKLASHPFTSMMPLGSPESVHIFTAARTLKGKIVAMKVAYRVMLNKIFGKRLRGAGNALQGRLYQIAIREEIPIWTQCPVRDFVVENGRVTGVIAERDGRTIKVGARLGVLVNAGGFSRNKEMREKYSRKPTSVNWTQVNPGDTGEMIQAIMNLGAATAQMDEAFWQACSFLPDGTTMGMHSGTDMGKPYCIVVDSNGKRFANEGASYMEFGQKTYEAGAVPAWIIMESRHRRYYPWGSMLPGITPQSLIDNGYVKKADTIEELARLCGIDPTNLVQTVSRFNEFVRKGVDEDFHRGESAYDRYYGDPTVKPNPNLGAIERPPYYAVAIYPGDVGTCGGIVADEHARALRPDGSPIPGLYVTGITSAAVVGRCYPGAGASVGPSMTFGYVAARHAVGAND
jgi:3-oxosteroid 1-dehydrogenase